MTRLAAARRTCVDGPELAWARRPLQHPELMAENEDLEVLGSVDSTSPSSPDEETDEGADDEVEERQHRPIVPGLSERESGFPTPTGTGGLSGVSAWLRVPPRHVTIFRFCRQNFSSRFGTRPQPATP